MGGKRTLRSIRKQSVPHMLGVVVEADVGLCGELVWATETVVARRW